MAAIKIKGRGTRDAIGSLRVLAERSLEHGQEVYICFVDYEKAFDRVDWRKLMTALRRRGIDWKDRRLIGNLYMNQKVKIRIDGECSEEGEIGRGVRQGCPLSLYPQAAAIAAEPPNFCPSRLAAGNFTA